MKKRMSPQALCCFAAFVAVVSGCGSDKEGSDGSVDQEDASVVEAALCVDDVSLEAWVQPGPVSSGVTVYGAAVAPSTTTVRAVLVAGAPASKSTFNYRGWSVQLSYDLLRAIALDGVARLPVIALTSAGCQQLPYDRQPVVRVVEAIDGGASVGDDAGADASAEDGQADAGVAGDAGPDGSAVEEGSDAGS